MIPWIWLVGSVYLLLLVAPRSLTGSEYGTVVSALSLFLVLAAGPIAMQSRSVPGPAGVDREAPPSMRLPWILVAVASLLLATPLLSAWLDLPLPPLLLLVPTMLVSSVASARVTTRSPWTVRIATITSAAAATARVVGGTVFLVAGAGVAGTIAALLIAELVGLIVGWTLGRSDVPGPSRPLSTSSRSSFPWPSVATFMLLAHLDLLLVNRLLTPIEAGRYASAAVPTRVLLLVPVVAMILISRMNVRGRSRTRSDGCIGSSSPPRSSLGSPRSPRSRSIVRSRSSRSERTSVAGCPSRSSR